MTITILLEEYCNYSQHIRGMSPQTIKRYREHVSYFTNYSKVSYLSECSKQATLSFFINGRANRNWSPATYRTYYMSLKVFFRWCRKNGYMEVDPLQDMELPKMKRSLPNGLSKENALKLLDWTYHLDYESEFQRVRNHAIFATFMYAGLRKGELLGLKLGDVDLKHNTLFIRQGKGGKDRIIPICPSLAYMLKPYLHERKKAKKTCLDFFASSKRDIGFTVAGLKHLTQRIRKQSGISFTIHGLRHTFATLMIEGGCDIYSLSKMLGHLDIKTTTIYLSASTEHLKKQITKHPMHNLFLGAES